MRKLNVAAWFCKQKRAKLKINNLFSYNNGFKFKETKIVIKYPGKTSITQINKISGEVFSIWYPSDYRTPTQKKWSIFISSNLSIIFFLSVPLKICLMSNVMFKSRCESVILSQFSQCPTHMIDVWLIQIQPWRVSPRLNQILISLTLRLPTFMRKGNIFCYVERMTCITITHMSASQIASLTSRPPCPCRDLR